MDHSPTSQVSEDGREQSRGRGAGAEDPQSSRKLSISSQVREYYAYSDSVVPAKLQSKSLPSDPSKSFGVEGWTNANKFQSLTDVYGRPLSQENNNVTYEKGDHPNRSLNQLETDSRHISNVAKRDIPFTRLVAESKEINEAVNAALQVSVDTSGPRIPSPASSIASNKRGLEWDSGADVGYQCEQRDSSHLSIMERLALARGSAAFQLDSSGNGTFVTPGDMSVSLKQKADVKSLSKSLASMDIAKSGKAAAPHGVEPLMSEPLAQSTPQEVDRRSLALAAAAEDNISPLKNSQVHNNMGHFPTMKSLSATDLYSQEKVSTTLLYSRRKSDTSSGLLWDANVLHHGAVRSSSNQKLSCRPSRGKQLDHEDMIRDQTLKTSEAVPMVDKFSVGVEGSEQSNSENKSRKESSSSSDRSVNKVSIAAAERFIAQIQRNASEHQKVIDKIKQQTTCTSRSTAATRGQTRERSSSSSDFNDTPFSANATNEHATIGSANSFEYLPGDMYENASARKLNLTNEPSSSEAIAWGVISNSLARDLEEGVQNFKSLLANKKQVDPSVKDQLIKRLVRKLIETDYQEDEESSTTGASVVYVPDHNVDGHVCSSRSPPQRQHRRKALPCNASSPLFDHGMHGDSSSRSQHFLPPSNSEHSSLPYNTSSSTSTTLETRDWRKALTQSEMRHYSSSNKRKPHSPEKRKPHSPGKRNDDLAQITRKIRYLNSLKHILELQDDKRFVGTAPKPSPNVYTVMTMLGTSGTETEEPAAISSTDLTPSEDNWSSHHRLGTTRTVQTQFPSRTQLADRETGTPSVSESWDTSLDHRARHGRINVYVQTTSREAEVRRSAEKQAAVDPLCCCQCERKLTKLKEMSMQMSMPKTPSVSCCCGCHSRVPKSPGCRQPTQYSSLVSDCSLQGSSRATSVTSQPAKRSHTRNVATSTMSVDDKNVQTTDSVAALPLIQPRQPRTNSKQEQKTEMEVCKCCGTKPGQQNSKILSESINQDNIPRPTNNRACNCILDLNGLKICLCEAANKSWDVSAISGKKSVPKNRNSASTRSRATETDPPKAVGYLLTFETPSTSDISFSEPPHQPPLKEMRVKARRPSATTHATSRSTSVDLPMQTSTPSAESVAEQRSRERNNHPDKSSSSSGSLPTLQDYLRSNRPNYISTAEHRRQCLAELVHLRELRLQSRRKLLAMASGPTIEILSSLPPPPLATKRVFSQRTMLRQTRRLHQRTEEVGRKRVDQKRKEDYRTNRLMAEMFARKLQKNVLKGSVNLSNSKSVI